MRNKSIAQDRTVLVGVDVHTKSHVVAVKVNGEIAQRRTLVPSREQWRCFLEQFPGCEVHVIYESGPHGYNLHDWLMEMNGQLEGTAVFVHIAPPANVPVQPGKRRVKTDRRDSVRLIQAFEMGSFEDVVVPDKGLRAQRELVRTRLRLKGEEKRLKNEIHGLVKYHGIEYPDKALRKWSEPWRRQLVANAKVVDGDVVMCVRLQLKVLGEIQKAVVVIEKKIASLYRRGSRCEIAQRIGGHKGIGIHGAMVIATEVADFGAFRNSDAFASYTGLVPGESSSGEVVRRGGITKEGNRRLRWIFVECAWAWVRYDREARERFYRLSCRKGKRKAIVAMARRLAVAVYHRARSNSVAA
ncbi:MAG: IS110 family transposase [bacterium]